MDEIVNIEQEKARRYTEKFNSFKATYAAQNPPPPYPKIDRWDWLETVGLVALVVASIIVSGSRTIPEFGGGVVGWAAFAMLELAIVAYAFIRTRSRPNENTMRNVQRWTNFGLVLAFIVAVSANIHATLIAHEVLIPDWVNTLITLFLGFSAPTLAFISGDIMAVKLLRATSAKSRADKQYQEAMKEWMEGLNTAWTPQQQKRWGADMKSLDAEVKLLISGQETKQLTDGHGRTRTDNIESLSDDADRRGRTMPDNVQFLSGVDEYGQANGRKKDKREMVRTYLVDNPEAIEWTVRQIAEEAGVGKTIAAEVVKEFRNEQ